MRDIKFSCPQCQTHLLVDSSTAGTSVVCPGCSASITVPASQPEGTPAQPPPAVIPFFWAPGWNSIQATNKYQTEIAGPLRGGVPGVRLVARAGGAETVPLGDAPKRFEPRRGEWLLVPLYHVFGSEELSRRAPAIAKLAPPPQLAMNGEDAAQSQLEAGELVQVTTNGTTARLPLSLDSRLPRGVAGVPAGTGALAGAELPSWGRIARA